MDNYGYGLMPEEVENFERFKTRHRKCRPDVREALIEESCAPALSEIILYMTSIGMMPSAKCLVCGPKESIACNKRIDSV